MSTQYTSKRGIPVFQFRDRNWHLPIIAAVDVYDVLIDGGALAIARTENPSTTLHVKVAGGPFRAANGTVVVYAGTASVTMTDNILNYLYLTNAAVLTVNTTGYPAATNIVALGTVLTAGGIVTAITPAKRIDQSFGAASIDLSGNVTANWGLFGPTSGGAAPPAFRALVAADMPIFVASGASHKSGAVPDPGVTAGTRKFLREDAAFTEPPVFIASGASHAVGYVPDPGASAGTVKFLLENATWAVPPVFVASGGSHAVGYVPDPGVTAGTARMLREDATWADPAIFGVAAPTPTAGTGAGTGPTLSATGSHRAGVISLTTGTGCAASADTVTMTFATAFGAAPKAVLLTPANAAAAALAVAAVPYVDSASTTASLFKIKSNGTALTDSIAYKWHYLVMG